LDRLAPPSLQEEPMIDYTYPTPPLTLPELIERGDKAIAAAHEAIAAARRLALETVEVRAETKRLHDRFHGPPSS
jgi:hypothetical protein